MAQTEVGQWGERRIDVSYHCVLVIPSPVTGVPGTSDMLKNGELPWIWLVIRHLRFNESKTELITEVLLLKLASSSTRSL